MHRIEGVTIPDVLAASCRKAPERVVWLERLPESVRELEARWRVAAGEPFETPEAACSWVAPAMLRDGGTAVLKLAMPHWEGEHEIAGLRFWDGDPTVRLLAADERWGAMLLERCEPGTRLRELPEAEQDVVIAGLLRRLWRAPAALHGFRPLSEMAARWAEETMAAAADWPDAGILRAGLELFMALPRSASSAVLLATDLHAGNVLRAEREP